jgi:hypothetical protein
VRYMVARLGQDYGQYVRLTAEYEDPGTPDPRRGEIETELQLVGDESHGENRGKEGEIGFELLIQHSVLYLSVARVALSTHH